MRITLNGKRWLFRRVAGLAKATKNIGECDAPSLPNKEIRIDDSLQDEKELEIILHECLHAVDWSKDESWVATTAEDVARALWKLGYRKQTE